MPTSKGTTTINLTYDGDGQRVKKQNPIGQTTLYFGEAYEVRGGVGVIHLFAGKQRVASVGSDGYTQFYHANHLGSACVITDQNGMRKERIEYFPFGSYREAIDYDGNFPDVNYTFTDQEDDDELGFYNFKARLYDPVLGRFISPDPIVPDPTDLQSFNRYSYVENNPLKYIDPTGNESEGGPDPGPGTDTGWGGGSSGASAGDMDDQFVLLLPPEDEANKKTNNPLPVDQDDPKTLPDVKTLPDFPKPLPDEVDKKRLPEDQKPKQVAMAHILVVITIGVLLGIEVVNLINAILKPEPPEMPEKHTDPAIPTLPTNPTKEPPNRITPIPPGSKGSKGSSGSPPSRPPGLRGP